ncbi:MAG: hypothetical protein U9O64_03535 [Campylobacterota bacterium]|nr:hypothetical protein [Campylobacterota bacterium]
MTKKILLSVAASALLSTSVFAGTLTTDTNDGINNNSISEESYLQNGMDIVDLLTLRYTAEIPVSLNLGSISDPQFALDITDLEFAAHIDGSNALVAGFDANGRGLTPAQLGAAQTNGIASILEDDYFTGSVMVDVDDNSIIPLVFSQLNEINGRWYAKYSGSSLFDMHDGHTYQILGAPQQNMPFKYQKNTGEYDGYIAAVLNTLTINGGAVDTDEFNPDTTFPKQFAVSCVRKFDGLINFENDRVSFVNPAHGERIDTTPTTTPNDTLVTSDRVIFEIENARLAGDTTTRWMSGHLSEFSVNTTYALGAPVNDFTSPAWFGSTVDIFVDPDLDNVDTLNPGNIGGGALISTASTLTFIYPDAPILPGTTKMEVNLATDSSEPIRPVKFTNPNVDLEGAVAPDEFRDGTVLVGSLVIANDVAQSTLDNPYRDIAPQNMTDPLPDNVGEWMDHAYIAQIAGASSTAAGMQTKLFIVNRSCITVTPQITLIKDGEKISLTGVASIDPDHQGFFDISALLETMIPGSTAGQDYAKYAIEVTLPGIAENFYMYAQVKNVTSGQFKDLPVYNTSNRD